jgi:hypothetical protein
MEPEDLLLCNWSLSSARLIRSILPHSISLRSILMLSNHLRIGLPTVLLPSSFPTKTLWAFLFPMHATFPAQLVFLDLVILIIIWRWVQIMKFLIIQFSPIFYYFKTPRSNILLSTLSINTLSLFSSLTTNGQFTHLRHNYNFVNFNFYAFR